MNNIYWCIGHELKLKNIETAKGCYLFDKNGKKYLDLESGIWSAILGHNHKRINNAIQEQLSKIVHTGYCYSSEIVNKAAKKILDINNIQDGKCVFLLSGSEAVEFGVKVIKNIFPKKYLLTLSDSFLSCYGSASEKRTVEWITFDWTECKSCRRETCNNSCEKINKLPFDKIGAFVFEPGSSSGLVRFPPSKVIKALVENVKVTGGFIHANEITTGFGRTGKWFGYQHYAMQPDIVSMGKGLGNGYPVSSIAMTKQVIENLEENHFHYSQSHQNDPLGCKVLYEVISVIEDDKLDKRASELGSYLLEELKPLINGEYLVEVRGRGLMISMDVNEGYDIQNIFNKLLDEGFILARRPGLNTLRIDPPIIIEKKDIDGFITSLKEIFKTIH